MWAFVIGGAQIEATGETLDGPFRLTCGRGGHDPGVDTTTHVGPDRNVRAQVHFHRFVEQLFETLVEPALRVLEIGLELNLPILPQLKMSIGGNEHVSWGYLLDTAKQGTAMQRILEREVLLQRFRVDFDRRQERQECLRLTRYEKQPVDHGVVERFDAESISRAEQSLLLLVPDRKSEHASQAIDATLTVATVGAEDGLGIGPGTKTLRADFSPKLKVVVDLTVVDNAGAALVDHRLRAGIRIEDGQANMGETDVPLVSKPEPLAVRSAVSQEFLHDGERRPKIPARVW